MDKRKSRLNSSRKVWSGHANIHAKLPDKRLRRLWKVDDDATAELMQEFYKQLLESGVSPAAALRQAQIVQMRKKSRQSPYYWAGFQLQGEWK